MSRSWDEVRAEAEATGKLNPRRPDYRTRELYRDMDRRNATVAPPSKDWSVWWLFGGIAVGLLLEVAVASFFAYLIIGAS